MASRYQTALVDPFSNAARGAKIPDMYAFPSDTYTIESEIIVSSDANGNFDFAVTPHPLASVYTNNVAKLTGYSNQWAFNGLGGLGIVSSCNISNFAEKVDSYRVVSVGAKVESLLIPTAATGTLTMAHLPSVEQTVLQDINIDGGTIEYLGLPVTDASGYFDKNMRVFPTGHAMNVSEWQGTGLSSCLRIITPDALEFRRGSNIMAVVSGQDQADVTLSDNTDNPVTATASAASPIMAVGSAYTITVSNFNTSGVANGDLLFAPVGTNYAIGTIYAFTSTSILFQAIGAFGAGGAWAAGQTLRVQKQQNPTLSKANKEYLRQGGWSMFCVRGAGFPINTQCATLRVCYNLETVDRNLNSNTFMGGQPSPVDITGFNQVLRNVQLLPYYRTLEQKLAPGDAAARRLGIA